LPTASVIENLERRRMLTNPAFNPVTVFVLEATSIAPYPSNSIAPGTVVATLTVVDPDPVGTDYSPGNLQITAGNTDVDNDGLQAFAIQPGTNNIIVQDPSDLNFEANPVFTLTVVATDNGGSTGTNTVTINLINGNDRPIVPQYPNGAINYAGINRIPEGLVNVLSVKENSFNGTIVGTVTAVDQDQSPSIEQSTLTYQFVGTIPGFNSATPAFAIDPFTGKIRVTDSSFLDYEARRNGSGVGNLGEYGLVGFADVTFAVQVRATDIRGLASSASTVFIRLRDVSETPPDVSKATKSMSVNENSPANLSVGFFDLIDGTPNFTNSPTRIAVSGLDPTEPQQRHSFFIVGGNTNNAFAIDQDTGEITVNNAAAINFETLNVYNLQIQVVDDNPHADNLPAVIAVTDVAPQSTIATLHITVNDINEPTVIPDDASKPSGKQTFTIPENTVNGTVVGAVIANDPDTQAPNGQAVLRYSIISGNVVKVGGVNYSSVFAIDPVTGVISVNNTTGLPNNVALDFENQPSFSLTIQCIDRGDISTSANNTIVISLTNVNEHPPAVQDGSATIAENRPFNDLVGQVVAAVGEIGNSITKFDIVSGNTDGAFAIDSVGRITVANPAAIDFEQHQQFTLVIKATDNGTPALFATGTFTINVTNLNEQIVMLDQSFNVNENTPNGTIIGTITTTDPDNEVTQVQGQSFVINGGNTGGAFSIDAQGHIVVANASALDFESTPSFSIVTTVTDTGIPSTSMAAIMTITLNNVNDAPVIGNQTFNVKEHSLKDTAVGTVQATDQDSPAQTLTYAITAGDPTGAFAIDAATGKITVTDPSLIDFATTPVFNLTVQVTDNGVPTLSSSATIKILLQDVQEPQLPDQTVTIPERTPNGTTVATATATHGVAPYTYTILSGNTNNAFSLDFATGALTVNNSTALSFLKNPVFSVKILAVDSQGTPLGDTGTITVNLTFVDQNPVLIGLETTTLNYTENVSTLATAPVTSTIVATDPDSNNAQTATIQITGNYINGEDKLLFNNTAKITGSWDASTGKLTLTGIDSLTNYRAALRSVQYQNLSHNPTASLRTVTFNITDDNGPLTSANVSRKINVIPVNNAPTVGSASNTLSYTEGSGAIVINSGITISDPDSVKFVSGTVTITNFVAAEDVLGFVANPGTMGNIALSSNNNGVLTLTSAGGTATQAQWQAALRSVTYTNVSGNLAPPARVVTFSVDDGSAVNHASNNFITTINITPLFPPVLSGANSLTYTELDPPTAIDPTISVSDPVKTTLAGATIQITNFVANQDVLAFVNDGATMGNIAILSNSGGLLTLTSAGAAATLAQWQSALAAVTYRNTNANPNLVARNVVFQVDNGAVVNSLSNPLTSTISINAVNNPPLLTNVDPLTSNYTENAVASVIIPSVLAADPDSDVLNGATIKITGNYAAQGSTDVLAFTNTAKIKGSWDATTGTLTLTGTDSVSNYRTALRSITFFNQNDPTVAPTRTVSFTVTDDTGLSSNTITHNIQITTVATAPKLSGIDTTPAIFKLNDPFTPLPKVGSNIIVTDFDSNNMLGAAIQITGNYNPSQDVLGFNIPASVTTKITGHWDPNTGTLTMSGVDTAAHYQAALQSVVYYNTVAPPSTLTRTISFSITDDTHLVSNSVTRLVSIATTNTAPTVSLNSAGAVFYTEKDPATLISPNFTVTDIDSPNLQGATVRITNNYQLGQDKLVFTTVGNIITGTFDTTTGTLSLKGSDTVANYQLALQSVKYVNTSNNPSSLTRTISFSASDGLLTSNVVSRNVTVVPIDDAPIIATNAAGALAYTPANGAVAIAPGLTVVDPDNDNLAGASVQITFNYQRGNDVLSFVNTAKITGSFNVATGILSLSGVDTVSNYRAALQAVKYQFVGTPLASTKTISFSATDGTLSSSVATRDISVTP